LRVGSIIRVAFVLLALPVVAHMDVAAQDDLTIRTRVEEVVVPFSVMDNGRFVAGLEAKDFVVLEDGVRQDIAQFSIDPVPLSAVVLLDTGVNADALEALKLSKESLVKAFNLTEQHARLGIADEVAVYRYNNFVSQISDFTSDEDTLRASLSEIDRFTGGVGLVGGEYPVESPEINGVRAIPSAPRPVTGDRRVLHDAINEATLALRTRGTDRRRVVVLFSDGSEEDSAISYEDVQLRLLEADVQIFPLYVRTGLFERIFGNTMSVLDDYADFTGGEVYATTPDGLDPLFPRITGQARSQYVITYSTTNEAPRDRLVFREIEVRTTSGRYDIFHRAGYYQAP
jgi:VWFA-related protein